MRRLTALLAFFAFLIALSPTSSQAQPLIVVDPGHGGSDPGAVGCSLEEAAVVLDVALRLRTQLEAAGLRVALTRDVDEFVGLSARASFANAMSADGFVSIHSNSNAGTPASGTETWIANAAGARSLSLAELLQDEMVAAWGLPDRGVKRADFVVVRDTTMPAALTELAFTNRCMPDAALLGDPSDRQRMAEAQARAILAWLGVAPGTDGTLRGVVFEDQGVGTMDLSVRLPGATVRIVETGATATAEGADAAWSFTLPPGTYTVEASAADHVTASRSCAVTAGGTTWCSVGLFPEMAPAPDAAMPPPDAAISVDATVPPSPDAADAPDAGTVARPTASGCSCGIASPRSEPVAPLALAGLLAVSLFVRRRGLHAKALVIASVALGALGCASDPSSTSSARLGTSTDHDTASAAEPRLRIAEGTPVTVLDETELLLRAPDDGATLGQPHLAPDARALVAAPADLDALYAWRAADPDTLVRLCDTAHCGYEPRFVDDIHVATRTPEQSGTAVPGDAFGLDGTPSATRLGAARGLAWIEGEDVVRVRISGATRTLRAHDDRFVHAELSPDARHVVVWGLTNGLALHRLADGARLDLGPGGHPRFDPDGRFLVFDRTEDDGHALTAGDVFIAELGDTVTVRAVARSARIETSPSISRVDASGRATLALEREGAIVLLRLAL